MTFPFGMLGETPNDHWRMAGPFVPNCFFTLNIEAQADNTTPLVTD
jgi:hypothetical protein